jgi:cytochrome P450
VVANSVWILDASSEFIFGQSLDSLSTGRGPADAKNFMTAFMYAQEVVGVRILLGRMSFLIRDRKFWDSCKLVQTFAQQQIDRALHRGTTQEGGTHKYNLVKEIAKENENHEALRGQLLNVFFAGRDTPAVALSNIVFCLARHPLAWDKIKEEVRELEPEDLSFEKLKSMRYLQHAINEGLRLHPPLPTIVRTCLTETVIPYGGGLDGSQPICVIPGDTVSCSVYTMHRDASVFGPDVDLFQPERWQDIRPGWNYLPFGGGARHCPAQQLALFWVSYTIARMAIEFSEIRNKDHIDEYVENWRLTMESLNGVKVGLVRAF